MKVTQHRSVAYMSLREDAFGAAVAADWIGKLFMLGRMVARWSRTHTESQLVVVLSVPVRDFAAVLVGCGWMTATPTPELPVVRDVLAELLLHAPVRVVSQTKVFTERFGGVNVAKDRARFGTDWKIDKLRAVAPLSALGETRRQTAPEPGVISRLTGLDKDWAARLCSPPRDLALVGTMTRLSEDLRALLGRGNELEPIANILLPPGPRVATWSTRIYAAAHLEEELLPAEVRVAVLDGAPATRHLSAIEAPVVVSILDRSVADESVSEVVMNYRNTQGAPVSLKHDLRWPSPTGVEALAFEVPL